MFHMVGQDGLLESEEDFIINSKILILNFFGYSPVRSFREGLQGIWLPVTNNSNGIFEKLQLNGGDRSKRSIFPIFKFMESNNSILKMK